MRMPFVVKYDLNNDSKEVFDKYFYNTKDKGYILDNLWFRTQDEKNKMFSNRKSENDVRRRVFHSMQKYNIQEKDGVCSLLLEDLFIYISLSMPEEEIKSYNEKLLYALNNNDWKLENDKYINEDLQLSFSFYENNYLDRFSNFPMNYSHLEILIKPVSTSFDFNHENNRIWELFKKGIRNKNTKTAAQRIDSIESIEKYFPAQIETGCGPSIELGVSPLHELHEIYKVQNKNGQFYMNETDTFLVDFINGVEKKFSSMSKLVKEFISCTPSDNHKKLNELFKLGIFKGEILSNNFDRMFSRTGLEERIVRVYERDNFYPNINFHPDVKSLIVIGSHADRRQIWKKARERGLKIIHINPNGYYEDNDLFFEKRIEDVCEDDLLLKVTYSEWIEMLYSHFKMELLEV